MTDASLGSIEGSIEPVEPRRSARLGPKKKPSAVPEVTSQPKKSKRPQPDPTATLEVIEMPAEEVVSPPSIAPPSTEESSDRSLTGITAEAKRLREQDPAKYGIKGAREGSPGYVKNGWKQALIDAAARFGCKSQASGRQKRADKATLNTQQKLAKQAYLEELRMLQVKYFPLIGRKVSAKATKQATKHAEELASADKV